jgi:hypothetical protein
MPVLRDITNQRFGRLTALRRVGKNRRGLHMWLFRCDCGAQRTIALSDATSGNTRSCGCLAREAKKQRFLTHGHARGEKPSGEYQAWSAMHRRCRNPHRTNYHGRDIRVCERWDKFENFLADMGPKPSPRHTLDRIDNDENYEPGNCRWATPREQANNSRRNHRITMAGRTQSIADWAREIGFPYKELHAFVVVGEKLIAKADRAALTAAASTRRSTTT